MTTHLIVKFELLRLASQTNVARAGCADGGK